MKKVLITGTFDIIHPGHLHLIKQAKELGDFVVAIIARDQNVLKIKGRLPYFNENQRLANLQKLVMVNKVVLGDLTDPYKMIEEENPDIIALGYDQQAFVNGLIDFRANSRIHFKIERLEPFKEDFCKGKNIRAAVEDKQAGFLLIDKEGSPFALDGVLENKGWTSHDAVAKLRSITKINQIGHAGTLDPFATGLLICAIGRATKMIALFDLLPKTYEATIKLGATSDTYDRTGQLTINKMHETKNKQVSILELQTVLNTFIGRQTQLPPMYSAKKVNGKKLYDLARKGVEIERRPSQIEIYNLELLDFQNDLLSIRVVCSAGTYIRSLAHDLGQKLGCGAVLQELKRTAIGGFNLLKAVALSELTLENYSRYLIPPLKTLDLINRSYLEKL